jgi:hypothetical protein
MTWVRTGDCPDEIKISFVVKRDRDPELAAYLWGLPYRQASQQVREILSSAARLAAAGRAEVNRRPEDTRGENTLSVPQQVAQPQVAQPTIAQPTVAVSAEQPHAYLDSDVIAPAQPSDSVDMARGIANLMRDMDENF